MICDIHAHLDLFSDEELAAALERAESAGVTDIIANSLERVTYEKTLALRSAYDGPIRIRMAAGFYPLAGLEADMEAGILPEADLDPERGLRFIEAHASEIVAIGEVGLDFTGTTSEQEERDSAIFERVLELAERLELPVVIHSRRAEKRVIELLEAHPNVTAVLHCFGGKLKLATRVLERKKTYFSVPVIIEHAEHFCKLVELIPERRLLTETDAPFLAPKDAERSEPAHIARTIGVIASIKGLDPRETENILYENARRVFGF